MIVLDIIQVGNYTTTDREGNSRAAFILYGLSSDGKVYRWNDRFNGWIPLSMEEKNPDVDQMVYMGRTAQSIVEEN